MELVDNNSRYTYTKCISDILIALKGPILNNFKLYFHVNHQLNIKSG